jgi:hypothetical protein
MVRDIFRLHDVPKSVVSDRNPRFTSDMWQAFWKQDRNNLVNVNGRSPANGWTDGSGESVNKLDVANGF